MPVGAEHDVVGGERIGRHEKAKVALDEPPLVLGQSVRILPQRDVTRHVHFLRHPVIGAGCEVLLPGPFVFERDQLVDIGRAIDDSLVGSVDAAQLGCPCIAAQVREFRTGCGWQRRAALAAGWKASGSRPRPALVCFSLICYWQASQSAKPGSPAFSRQTLPSASGIAAADGAASAATAFSCPVRVVVDFSAWVAPIVRR